MLTRLVHRMLRHWFLTRIAKAIYEVDPVPGWDFDKLREYSQSGNPLAERVYGGAYKAADIMLYVISGDKP